MPGGLDRRIGVLEAEVERRVEERLKEELEAAFDRLQRALSNEEAGRMFEILASEERD